MPYVDPRTVEDGSRYRVQLVAHVQHVHGAEPKWDAVADAVCVEMMGATLDVEGGRVLVDQVELDEAQ